MKMHVQVYIEIEGEEVVNEIYDTNWKGEPFNPEYLQSERWVSDTVKLELDDVVRRATKDLS